MAVNNLEKYTAADGLGFPLNFRRGNPNPLDNSSVWSSLEAAQNYAQTDPTAYVGQVLSVVAGEDVKVYFIKNKNGDLEEMSIEASMTAMDNRMDAVEGALGLGGEAGEGSVTVDKKIENAVADEAKARGEAIEAESVIREAAEKEIQDSVTALSTTHAIDKAALEAAIATEKSRAENVEGKLAEDLAAEVTRATGAEKTLTDNLATEKERAEGAEQALGARIDGVEDEADALEVRVKANEDAIGALNGEGAGSVKKTVDDAINKFASDVTDDGTVNSFKELVDWAATHGSEAAEMVAAIEALEAILAGIGGADQKATVVAYVEDAIAALKIGDYAKAADLTAAIERIAANEAAIKTINETTIPAAQAAAEKVANDNNTAMDNRVKVLEAIDHEAYKAYADQAEADALAAAKTYSDGNLIAAKEYADQAEADAKAHTNARETAIMTEVNKKVNAEENKRLMTNDEGTKLAGIETGAEVNIIEIIKVNGKAVTVSAADRSVDISHNIGDLEQDADSYIVFDCGSATVNI